MHPRTSQTRLSLLSLCLAALAPQAGAQMALTPGAITAGFGLTTFATGFPTETAIGPLGIAFNGSSVIVSDYPGNVRVFSTDTDGQTAASAPVGQNYGAHNAVGLAKVGGAFYMTQQANGDVVQINPNGTFNQVIKTGLPSAAGIVTNPVNGHIFASIGGSEVVDIDPLAKTSRVFKNIVADGLTTDGTTLYAATSGHVIGYRLSDGAQVFDAGAIGDVPDGAALGTGALAGEIFVNTNGGRLLEYNLTGVPVATLIGTGGSRGDFVTVDPTNGTLLLTQSDRILRLSFQGGGFGSTPEPGVLALLSGLGVVAVGLLRRRK